MYLKQIKLRYDAIIEQVHFKEERKLPKNQFLELADCSFIDRSENILLAGLTGTGKSFVACAIGHQACSLGYKTLYFGMNRFLKMITLTKLDGSYIKALNKIEKTSLVILDDFGLFPLDATTRRAVLQILEDRYGRRSTIIASQLPVESWYEYIGESTISDAIIDRMSASAHQFNLEGPSK